MTLDDADLGTVLEAVKALWPHSTLGDNPEVAYDLWQQVLSPYTAAEVQAAIVGLARQGREHAPPVGVVAQAVEQGRNAPPPSFEDAMAILGKNYRCLPYHPSGANPPSDLPVALENLTRAGVPEPVLRLVAALGVYAIRTMPDGSQHPLDPNQRAVRRDAARTYTQDVLPDLKSVPTPGLALRRAVSLYGQPDPARLIDVARLERRRLERRQRPAALPAPEPEGEGPSPEEVEEMLRRTREGISATRADRARAEREQREREDEEVRQAAAELAEHARRRRAQQAPPEPEPPQAA